MINTEMKKFGFLVHPRSIKDIKNTYKFLKIVPVPILNYFIKFLKPQILSKFQFKFNDNKFVSGYLIGIFLTADQMMSLSSQFVKNKILKAINLGNKLNIGIIGLGGLTASATKGGLDLINTSNIGITNGNAFTVSASLAGLLDYLKINNIDISYKKVCIIGATGSIGEGISQKLAYLTSNLLLVGRTKSHLKELKQKLLNINNKLAVIYDINIENVKNSDIIIMATSSSKALLKSEFIKKDAIIYDISQPKNVSIDVIKNRQDVCVINGGLVAVNGLDVGLNIFLPKGIIYGCLAETILLAMECKYNNFSIGKVTIEQIDEISKIGDKYGFKPFIKYQKVYD